MDSRPLGRTGISVSAFIFGAGSIGGIGSSPATRGHGLSPDQGLARVASLREVARRQGVSVSSLALAWLLANPLVTAPIVSPSKPGQWRAVREALAFTFTEEEHAEISAIFT